jgi:hypothetical protein
MHPDQSFRDFLDLRGREKIACACFQRLGRAIHHLEEAVGDGAKEWRVVGIEGIDLDRDLCRGLVEGGDGALRKGQGIVVDGEVADGDAVRGRYLQRLAARRIDELRAVAVHLEARELLEGEGALDPVGRALFEIEHDPDRFAALAGIGGGLLDRRDRFRKSSVRVNATATETRHVEHNQPRFRSRPGSACSHQDRCGRQQ